MAAYYDPWAPTRELLLDPPTLGLVLARTDAWLARLVCRAFRDAAPAGRITFATVSSPERLKIARSATWRDVACPLDVVTRVAARVGCVEVLAEFEPSCHDAVCASAAEAGQ